MSVFETMAADQAEATTTEPEAPPTEGTPSGGGAATPPPAGPKDRRRRRKVIAVIVVLALLAALASVAGWYLLNRKPLTELPGLATAKLPHYERSIYGVSEPLGVAVSADGERIYVTQSGTDPAVLVFDKDGKKLGRLSVPGQTGAMPQPVYLAIDPTNQDLYVSDRLAKVLYIFDAKGSYLRTFEPKGSFDGKWSPLALAFAPDGTLYASDVLSSDPTKHRIVVFGPDGTYERSFGAPKLNYPNGIWADSQGNAWVADSSDGRLVVVDRTGKSLTEISRGMGDGDLGMPRGVGIDDSGRLFIVDTTDHMVRVYTVGPTAGDTPAYVGSIGGEGRLDGTFEYPNGLALDQRAHVYVTDRENNRVQVWGY